MKTASSRLRAQDVTVGDVEEAIVDAEIVITPDDIPYLDNENVVGGKFIDDDNFDDESVTGKVRAPRRLKTGYEPPAITSGSAKSGIPALDEWMDFFSRVLLRTATDFYIDWAFRGIDEELLSDRDIERIKLAPEERNRIAKPFAEFAYKNKFARKHGREIIATAGSFDAILQLGMWFSRVSRIAAKYKGPARPKRNQHHHEPQTPVVTIQPEPQSEGVVHERSGQSSQDTATRFKPVVNGAVFRVGD